MIANKEKLRSFLKAKKLSEKDFAALLNIEQNETDKLLNGESVGKETAHNFIYFFKAELAQHYIDWQATGVKNPLAENNENN